jgi:hypothetical protein
MGVVGPSQEVGKAILPHEYASCCENGLHIERNVAVQLRVRERAHKGEVRAESA